MKKSLHMPYHSQKKVDGVWCSICPECGKAIPMNQKDSESFRIDQKAVDHFYDAHPEKMV